MQEGMQEWEPTHQTQGFRVSAIPVQPPPPQYPRIMMGTRNGRLGFGPGRKPQTQHWNIIRLCFNFCRVFTRERRFVKYHYFDWMHSMDFMPGCFGFEEWGVALGRSKAHGPSRWRAGSKSPVGTHIWRTKKNATCYILHATCYTSLLIHFC